MEFSSVKNLKDLLKKHGLSPRKGLGQNFLIDAEVLEKIIETADLGPDDIILEIGPGLGVLTLELAKNAGQVIAVEKDEKMAEILKNILKELNITNTEIIVGDILKLNPRPYTLDPNNYKVVANLPYYITAPFIRKFLEGGNPPQEMVLMVQKEVAQRITAKPPKMNLLAVSVQFYAEPEIISFVLKKSFWPQPKVDSAILKIRSTKHEARNINESLFFRIVKAGFLHPRKQILNNFAKGLKWNNKEEIISWLAKNKIKPEQRAETLTIADWINLTKTFPQS